MKVYGVYETERVKFFLVETTVFGDEQSCLKISATMPVRVLLLSCFLVAGYAATAQTNHIKLYLGFELANRLSLDYDNPVPSSLLFRQFYATHPFYALAFARENVNGSFWEISGQTNAYFGYKPVYEQIDSIVFPWPEIGKERNNYAQLQFDHNWLLSPASEQKVKPYLGIFLRASGQWATFRPSSSAYFPQETWKIVLSPGVVSRLQILTGTRWRLDLSALIVLGYFGLERRRFEDPALTQSQQRSSNAELSMLNLDTQVRLGFSYALGTPTAQSSAPSNQ